MRNNYSLFKLFGGVLLSAMLFFACKEEETPDKEIDDNPNEELPVVSISMDEIYQEMIGFGGALSWYCDRITSSDQKEEITDLMFEDLGIDILRLKNWYYPVDYPENKSDATMEISWFKQHFDATNELAAIAKSKSPAVEILFSSWGPPSGLKSNGSTREGTLKKDNGEFMYDAYVTYWRDILDHITFTPDYLSIQNEPSYVNEGWETCEWRPTETSSFPGYDTAFDRVYNDVIKDMDNPPVMIGPESANLGNSSFFAFSNALKGKSWLGAYAYHPYNFNEGTGLSSTVVPLEKIKSDYGDKPGIMTEYSGMSWLKTARFIHHNLVYANASGYVYWELMWAEDSENAMVRVDGSGNFEKTEFYYLIKHFSKFIDKGYERVKVESTSANADISAFINPAKNEITLVLINPQSSELELELEVNSDQVTETAVFYQSTNEEFFIDKTGDPVVLKGKSISTIVIEL